MRKLILLLPAVMLMGAPVRAERRDRLAEFINTEVSHVSEALNKESDTDQTDGGLEGWDMTNFYLQLKATVGFELPFMANLTLVPTIELVFHKIDDAPSQF